MNRREVRYGGAALAQSVPNNLRVDGLGKLQFFKLRLIVKRVLLEPF